MDGMTGEIGEIFIKIGGQIDGLEKAVGRIENEIAGRVKKSADSVADHQKRKSKEVADTTERDAAKAADAKIKSEEKAYREMSAMAAKAADAKIKSEEKAYREMSAMWEKLKRQSAKDASERVRQAESEAAAKRKATARMADASSQVGNALTYGASVPAAAFLTSAVGSAIKLENAFAQARTAGALTEDQLVTLQKQAERLSEENKNLGKTTIEYVAATREGIKAGQSFENAMASSKAAVDLSVAANMDASESAKILANALNVFKLSGTDSTKVANTLAGAANAAAGELSDMMLGFQQSSAVAANFGLSVEELSTALGLMANNGVLGSDAGTSLKSMMLQLMNPSKEARKYIKELGIEIYDSERRIKPFVQIIQELSNAASKLNPQARNVALGEMFGSDGIRAALTLIKEGTEGFNSFQSEVQKSGDAAKMSAGQFGETQKLINALKVDFDKFARESGKDVVQIFRDMLKVGKDVIGIWRELPDWIKDNTGKFILLSAALGPIFKGLSSILSIAKALEGVTLPSVIAKWGTSISGLSTKVGGLVRGLMSLGSIAGGSIVGGIAGAGIIGYNVFRDMDKNARDNQNRLNTGNAELLAAEKKRNEAMLRQYNEGLKRFGGDAISAKSFALKGLGKDAPYDYMRALYPDQASAILEKLISGIPRKSAPKVPVSSGSGRTPSGMNEDGTLKEPTKGGSSAGERRAAEERLTDDFIRAVAKGIRTPKGEASCAYFASQVLQQTGVAVKKEGGAKALVDAVLSGGGRKVDRKDAKTGDLVYYFGPGYGAKNNRNFVENGMRGGYHVGIYNGDGTVTDSSDGRVRTMRGITSAARFIRPMRGGSKFNNVGEIAIQNIRDIEAAEVEMIKRQQEIAESLEPLRKMQRLNAAQKLQSSGGMLFDVVSTELFGKDFRDIELEKNKNAARAEVAKRAKEMNDASKKSKFESFVQGWNQNAEKMWDRVRASQAERKAVADLMQSYQDILNPLSDMTMAEQLKITVKREGLNLTAKELEDLTNLAIAIDAKRVQEKLDAEQKERNMALDRDRLQGVQQYIEAMRGMTERTLRLGNSAKFTEFQMKRFAMSFSGVTEESKITEDGMRMAKEYIDQMLKVENLEMWRNVGNSIGNTLVEPIKDAFTQLVRGDLPSLTRSMIGLVENVLNEMTNQIIEAQIRMGINRLVEWGMGQLFASAFGGGKSAQMQGPPKPSSFTAPNLGFINQDSYAMSSASSAKMATSGVTQYITINVNGQDSSETARQIALRIKSEADAAARDIG